MALPEQYLLTTKNLDAFFNSILSAQAPPKFTNKFLEQLEFKSTNDRLFIGVLKFLGFIDSNGIPQERYFKFLDQTQSKQILAASIKESYSDLFAVNIKANEMTVNEVKNKLKTLTQGTKSDTVLSCMANTFTSLVKYADFSKQQTTELKAISRIDTQEQEEESSNKNEHKLTQELVNKSITTEMHYNIQIHLPETRDMAVYDAIFKSLKEHLL
jgi:Family of unknown function (DUF5343)